MRGFNIHQASVETSLRALSAYGAKTCRWQIARHDAHQLNMTEYQMWWNHQIGRILSACEFIEQNNLGINLIVDCHSPPGPTANRQHAIIHSSHWRALWCTLWGDAALTLKSRDEIDGFDICNEPWVRNQSKWLRVARQCVERIRAFDKEKWIYVSSKLGSPRFFKDMEPVPGRKVSYTCHYYLPKEVAFGSSQRVSPLVMKKVRYLRKIKKTQIFTVIYVLKKRWIHLKII